MLSPDDITQNTGPLEPSSPVLDRPSTSGEQRQQRQTTDVLSTLNDTVAETADVKSAHRQVMKLRQENRRLHLELEGLRQESRRLRPELEALRSEREQLVARLSALQKEFDENVATIHSGHLHETEHYERHLRELMEEHNRLQAAHLELGQHYQELHHSFQSTVQEEACKRVAEAARALEHSPEEVPPLLADVIKILEPRTRQEEEQHLLEILSLKREVKRLAEQLEQERLQLEAERQQVAVMRQTAYEQAKLRQTVLQTRLNVRWTARFAAVTTTVLFLLVILQILFLGFFRVHISALISLSLIAPIVVCIIAAVLLAYPSSMMNRIRASLPRKKAVKGGTSGKKEQKK